MSLKRKNIFLRVKQDCFVVDFHSKSPTVRRRAGESRRSHSLGYPHRGTIYAGTESTVNTAITNHTVKDQVEAHSKPRVQRAGVRLGHLPCHLLNEVVSLSIRETTIMKGYCGNFFRLWAWSHVL